jgi:hypothetical protein
MKKVLKKEITPKEIEVVYSKKYTCFITKKDAYFDENRQDYLSEKIEDSIKNNPNFKI